MKRIGNLYEKIYDINNIKTAILKSAKYKNNKRNVAKVLNNIDYYAYLVQTMLITQTYKIGDNCHKLIQDGVSKKIRDITIPKYFPDQIIHWSLMLIIKPIIEKSMYQYCCGSVPGRGTIYIKNYIEKIFIHDKKVKYCLKLDIKKYYPSVNIRILKLLIRRKIKCPLTLKLIDDILGNEEKGLPIGYYTSQWFSNFYLETLDHYIKEVLKIKYYMRYVDDMVLIDTNKRKLHKARIAIDDYLKTNLDLTLKENWQVFNLNTRCIDFAGFKFYKNKPIKLRKHIFIKLHRRIAKVKKTGHVCVSQARSILSLVGWLKQTKSYNIYNKNVKPYAKIGFLKKIVSNYEKRRKRNDCKRQDRSNCGGTQKKTGPNG